MKALNVVVYALLVEDRVIYIGTTGQNLRARLANHYSSALSGKSNKLHKWIRETNPSLTIREVAICPPGEQWRSEAYFIVLYDTINNGFNMEIPTQHGRPKRASNPKGKDHYLYGKKMPEHVKEAARRANTGRKMTQAHRKALHGAASRAKMMEKMAVRVRCVETGEVFASVMDAARWAAPSKPKGHFSIRVCLKKNDKGIPASALGYHWERVTQ
jgi:hypothetical protein